MHLTSAMKEKNTLKLWVHMYDFSHYAKVTRGCLTSNEKEIIRRAVASHFSLCLLLCFLFLSIIIIIHLCMRRRGGRCPTAIGNTSFRNCRFRNLEEDAECKKNGHAHTVNHGDKRCLLSDEKKKSEIKS